MNEPPIPSLYEGGAALAVPPSVLGGAIKHPRRFTRRGFRLSKNLFGWFGGPQPSKCNPNPATCAADSEALRSKVSLHCFLPGRLIEPRGKQCKYSEKDAAGGLFRHAECGAAPRGRAACFVFRPVVSRPGLIVHEASFNPAPRCRRLPPLPARACTCRPCSATHSAARRRSLPPFDK